MSTSGPDPVMPTFARELDDLADSHLARWLAEVAGPGPVLLWRCDRDLAVPLTNDPGRPVVLLTDDEGEATRTIRHGAPGLRVAHVPSHGSVPDVTQLGMTGFATIVARVEPSDPVDAVLAALLDLGLPGCAVCLLADAALVPVAISSLRALGREAEVLDHGIGACSHITAATSVAGSAPAAVGAWDDRIAARHLVTCGLATTTTPSILVGEEQGLSHWRDGVDQIASTVAALDDQVERLRSARVEALERELVDLRAQLEAARAAELAASFELRALRESSSWRVTRPLRVVGDRLRRG